jgi:hypothetical protein
MIVHSVHLDLTLVTVAPTIQQGLTTVRSVTTGAKLTRTCNLALEKARPMPAPAYLARGVIRGNTSLIGAKLVTVQTTLTSVSRAPTAVLKLITTQPEHTYCPLAVESTTCRPEPVQPAITAAAGSTYCMHVTGLRIPVNRFVPLVTLAHLASTCSLGVMVVEITRLIEFACRA